ncbi:MAG: hypothetical protein M1541_14935 [Acidobacteria bacterium]|nr:hypothetical protein [Acidobacteriota bacterium]
MNDPVFTYDVFLSHSAKDKAVVRAVAWRAANLSSPLQTSTFAFRTSDFPFPLRLDDASIKGSLAQFLYINWLPAARDQENGKQGYE